LAAVLPASLYVSVRIVAAKAFINLPQTPGIAWLEQALLRAEEVSDLDLELDVHLALGQQGHYFRTPGRPDRYFRRAIAIAEENANDQRLVAAWLGLAELQHHRGEDPSEALAQCVRASQRIGDDWSEARALLLMARRVSTPLARQQLATAEPIFWRYGDRGSLSALLQRQATLATHLEDHKRARSILLAGWSRLWPDPQSIARAWLEIALADLCLDSGDLDEFYVHNESGLRLARRLGSMSFEAHSLLLSSRAAMLQGDRSLALSTSAMSLALPLDAHPTRKAMLEAHHRMLETWCGRPTPLGESGPWQVPYKGDVLVLRALHAAMLEDHEACRRLLGEAEKVIPPTERPLYGCLAAIAELAGLEFLGGYSAQGPRAHGPPKWAGQMALLLLPKGKSS
jgi:hypothetical protein